MQHTPFYLFGMGTRRKILYRAGCLTDALTAEPLRQWDVAAERIEPAGYRVVLDLHGGGPVTIAEDEEAVWIEERGNRIALTRGAVRLPRFENHVRGALLRRLHAEILVNLVPAGPVPNLWVYPRPWYRDAAMMLMCLKETGNLNLVEAWVNGLHKPFDRNNAGVGEADNLGEVLYVISLVSGRSHPLVDVVLKEIPKLQSGQHVVGLTDAAEHPVYQTKWLKYGLRALGLDDAYEIPETYDSYSALFWMDFRDRHVAGERFSKRSALLYPYLRWAEAHFYWEAPPAIDESAYPLTWEGRGSEADYARMAAVSAECAAERQCTPHTWHAAEMFLYVLADTLQKCGEKCTCSGGG